MARFTSFWLFPLISAALLLANAPDSYRTLPYLFLSGLLMWTVMEYIFHRVLLHHRFRGPFLHKVIASAHMRHHATPGDANHILVYPSFALVFSTIIYASLALLTGSGYATTGIISGIWAGFLYYEAVHYRVHVSLKSSGLLQRQRRAHFHHHFADSSTCFGVTSPIWDYIFGTGPTSGRSS